MTAKHALMIFVGSLVSVAIIARVKPLRDLAGF